MPQEDMTYSKPIVVKTRSDLQSKINAICERINADPELARLVLVNAILYLIVGVGGVHL